VDETLNNFDVENIKIEEIEILKGQLRGFVISTLTVSLL